MYIIRALVLENSNAILFYNSKTPLYQYTIPFYNIFTSQNSIFIKILFFNPFFIISFQPFSLIFLDFPTAIFIPLSQPLAPVQHTTHTHPWYTDQPIQTHHHTHTHTHTHKHKHKHKHKPSNQLEPTMATTPTTQATDQQTQATDLKPMPPI